MSKVEAVRPRHIAFRVEAAVPVSRRAIGLAVRDMAAGWPAEQAPKLTRFLHPHGLVRVPHDAQAKCVAALAALRQVAEGGKPVAVKVTTLGASGTIRALTERLGILKTRDPS